MAQVYLQGTPTPTPPMAFTATGDTSSPGVGSMVVPFALGSTASLGLVYGTDLVKDTFQSGEVYNKIKDNPAKYLENGLKRAEKAGDKVAADKFRTLIKDAQSGAVTGTGTDANKGLKFPDKDYVEWENQQVRKYSYKGKVDPKRLGIGDIKLFEAGDLAKSANELEQAQAELATVLDRQRILDAELKRYRELHHDVGTSYDLGKDTNAELKRLEELQAELQTHNTAPGNSIDNFPKKSELEALEKSHGTGLTGTTGTNGTPGRIKELEDRILELEGKETEYRTIGNDDLIPDLRKDLRQAREELLEAQRKIAKNPEYRGKINRQLQIAYDLDDEVFAHDEEIRKINKELADLTDEAAKTKLRNKIAEIEKVRDAKSAVIKRVTNTTDGVAAKMTAAITNGTADPKVAATNIKELMTQTGTGRIAAADGIVGEITTAKATVFEKLKTHTVNQTRFNLFNQSGEITEEMLRKELGGIKGKLGEIAGSAAKSEATGIGKLSEGCKGMVQDVGKYIKDVNWKDPRTYCVIVGGGALLTALKYLIFPNRQAAQ